MHLTLSSPRDDGRNSPVAPVGGKAPPQPRADWAWFLDIDGTLVSIAESPDHVRVTPSLLGLLSSVSEAAGGALALVSGRTIDAIDRLFMPHRFPAAGQHGAERRDFSGRMHSHAAMSGHFRKLVDRAHAWAADHPGILVEDKGLSVAVHYRAAPRLAPAVARFTRSLARECAGSLELQHGKMVFEIKPAGRDKGVAVKDFALEAPFSGRRPVFIGDDASDEFAFAAINDLDGVSVKVGSGPTCARWRLPGVNDVLVYLAGIFAPARKPAELPRGARCRSGLW